MLFVLNQNGTTILQSANSISSLSTRYIHLAKHPSANVINKAADNINCSHHEMVPVQ